MFATGYLVILGLVWGSFLNMVGYRILQPILFKKPRSFCPQCHTTLTWYDLMPVVSWILLRGKCRTCQSTISWLYPFIELLTAISIPTLYYAVPAQYFFTYFLFFSTLIITIRTDFEQFLISRFVTTWIIPFVFIAAYYNYLPITLEQSLQGALFGYAFLFFIQKLFWWITQKQGMGDGDLELLAYIGAVTGTFGAWTTVVLSSVLGTLIGTIYLLATKQKNSIFPFGPALASAAMAFIIWNKQIITIYASMAS